MFVIDCNRKRGNRKKQDKADYFNAVNNGILSFQDHIYENIPDDENRNYRCHVEASYLCHGIWTRLMHNECTNKPYPGNDLLWNDSSAANDNLKFHFDIMHNPKKTRNKYSCGLFSLCDEQLRKDTESIYHSIGNMSPIPWFKTCNNNYVDGQKLHASVDERWDIYLQLLKDN